MAWSTELCQSSGNINLPTEYSWHTKYSGSQMILFILNPTRKAGKSSRDVLYREDEK